VQNQTTSWLVHSRSTFGATTSHEQTQTQKTHHNPDLGEATTFPFIIYFVPLHEAHPNGILSRDSQVGVPKFPQLGLPQFCRPITLRAELQLK